MRFLPIALHSIAALAGAEDAPWRRVESVQVEVVDRAGRPVAGVPVAAMRDAHRQRSLRQLLARAESGADGRATLRWRSSDLGWVAPGQRDDIIVELHFPHLEDVHARLEREDGGRGELLIPEAPPRLILPPTRPAEIRVLDDHGHPIRGLGTLLVGLADRPELPPFDEARGLMPDLPTVGVPTEHGHARLPFVGRGGRLFAGSPQPIGGHTIHGRDFGAIDALAEAPLASGGRGLQLELTARPPGSVLRGRLLTPDGTTAANRQMHVFHWPLDRDFWEYATPAAETWPPWCDVLSTDANGRFTVNAPEPGAALGSDRDDPQVLYLAALDERGAIDAAVPIVITPGLWGQRDRLVGEFQLIAARRLASGRLVDDRGEPLADTPFDLDVDRTQPLPQPPPDQGLRLLLQRLLPGDRRRTDDSGRFDLRSFVDTSARTFTFMVDAEVTNAAPIAVGAHGIDVRLARAASLRTRLVLPDGVEPVQVTLEVVDATGSPLADVAAAGRFEREILIRAEPDAVGASARRLFVPPGTGWLRVIGATTSDSWHIGPTALSRELLRIGPLVLEPGAECGDPRLAEIDLRDAFVVRRFAVVDGGRPVAAGLVHLRTLDGRGAVHPIEFRDGHACVAVPREAAEELQLEVTAAEGPALLLAWRDLGDIVELTPHTIELTVLARGADGVVTPLPPLPPLMVTLWQETPDGTRRAPTVARALPADGRVELRIVRPGRWRCSLSWWDHDHVEQFVPPPADAALATQWGAIEIAAEPRRTAWTIEFAANQVAALLENRGGH